MLQLPRCRDIVCLTMQVDNGSGGATATSTGEAGDVARQPTPHPAAPMQLRETLSTESVFAPGGPMEQPPQQPAAATPRGDSASVQFGEVFSGDGAAGVPRCYSVPYPGPGEGYAPSAFGGSSADQAALLMEVHQQLAMQAGSGDGLGGSIGPLGSMMRAGSDGLAVGGHPASAYPSASDFGDVYPMPSNSGAVGAHMHVMVWVCSPPPTVQCTMTRHVVQHTGACVPCIARLGLHAHLQQSWAPMSFCAALCSSGRPRPPRRREAAAALDTGPAPQLLIRRGAAWRAAAGVPPFFGELQTVSSRLHVPLQLLLNSQLLAGYNTCDQLGPRVRLQVPAVSCTSPFGGPVPVRFQR
jgi:hypothetical protein